MSFIAIPYPAIDPVALHLGPLSIKWYGLAYVAGLLLGWLYLRRLLAQPRLWQDNKPPFPPDIADDLFIWVAAGVVLGGRLGHILLYEPSYYWQNPVEILKIWHGGMAFHGGLLGTVVAMWLFARHRGVQPLSVMDLVSAAVPIGLFFGRLANFVNAEVVGKESSVPWAMVFPGSGPNPRHPSQVYEAVLEGLVLFLILRVLTHRKDALKRPGTVGSVFLIGYGSFRFFCEFFKLDEYRQGLGNLPLSLGMIYSLPMIAIGLIGLIWVQRRAKAAHA
jgi:phosphatidylglycerol:prolipoprotein diacylglycerol transferase